VVALGRNENLGEEWRAGNPHWERARAAIEELVQQEEARRGPLMPFDPRGMAAAVEEIGIGDQELQLLRAFLESPHGRNMIALMDHGLAAYVSEEIGKSAEFTAEGKARALELRGRVRAKFQDVLRALSASAKAQSVEDAWFGLLLSKLGGEMRGRQLGRQMSLDKARRIAETMVFGGYSAVREEIEAFRRAFKTKV
jgi:hypothetical protein